MDYINSTPAADGFRMPAEFERHQGCIMIWPERPGSWAYGAKAAKKAFAQIASVISESEQVYMIVSEGRKEEAAKMLPETVRLCSHGYRRCMGKRYRSYIRCEWKCGYTI